MALTNTEELDVFDTTVKVSVEEAAETQTEIEIISTVDDDFSLDSKYHRNILGQTIGDYIERTTYHLTKLKTRLNTLVTINRLPTELFTYIILLTNSPDPVDRDHHYIHFTWVCRYWRSVLIRHPEFWTLIPLEPEGEPITPFVQELLRRSKFAKLDVRLTINFEQFVPMLQDFLAKESSRIQTLWLRSDYPPLIQSVFAGRHFPLLRGLVHEYDSQNNGLDGLLPCIVASEHLETLGCSLWNIDNPMDLVDQLTPVFNRIRHLSLKFPTQSILESVLDLLQKNTSLHTLRLEREVTHTLNFSHQVILPELQSLFLDNVDLLEIIQAPKLASVDVDCHSQLTTNDSILKDFDFSSIRYMHILEKEEEGSWYSIDGLKEPVHSQRVFSIERSKDSSEEDLFANDVAAILAINNGILSHTRRCDYFSFTFFMEEGASARTAAVHEALPAILPRLTGLLELCISSISLIDYEPFHFEDVLAQVPSLEKLIIPFGGELKKFIPILSNTSLCPRLMYLSFSAWYDSSKELEGFAEDVGKSLAECLQSRHEACCNVLEYIALWNCPPLPDTWLKEFEKLGSTVVTEKDAESVRVLDLLELDSDSGEALALDTKRGMLKQKIGEYVESTANHLVKLKIRLNALVAINRLPINLLTRIIFLTTSSTRNELEGKHAYISYTWVCHHWRYVIIQCPDLWTSLQFESNSEGDYISPFVRELLGRSKDAKLEIRLKLNSPSNLPVLQDFFAKEGSRIRTLWLHAYHPNLPKLIKSVFSDRQFPSLQRFIYHCGNIEIGCNGLRALLPCIVTSENLEILECSLWQEGVVRQLNPVFNRLRALTIYMISSDAVLRSVLDLLHNNTRLHALQLSLNPSFLPLELSGQTSLPELRFLYTDVSLLKIIQAPKLSGLDIQCGSPLTLDSPILKGFDFSSIKYLHILKRNSRCSILGLKHHIHPTSIFSSSGDLSEKIRFAHEVQDIANASGDALDIWSPEFFHLLLPSEDVLDQTLDVLSSIFPRLTGLLELCLMFNIVVVRDRETRFGEIVAQIPSLETLIILYGLDLVDEIPLFNSASLCPRLKHLSYVTAYLYDGVPERCKLKITEKVGRLLTECLQQRQQVHGSNRLNTIAFGNFPPLPDCWLEELKKLGTTVLTETAVELKGWNRILPTLDYADFVVRSQSPDENEIVNI